MTVECNGATYQLEYDLNAFCEVEKETQLNLFSSLNQGLSMILFRAAIYALLKPRQPEITLFQVGVLVTPKNIGIWTGAFREIFEA